MRKSPTHATYDLGRYIHKEDSPCSLVFFWEKFIDTLLLFTLVLCFSKSVKSNRLHFWLYCMLYSELNILFLPVDKTQVSVLSIAMRLNHQIRFHFRTYLGPTFAKENKNTVVSIWRFWHSVDVEIVKIKLILLSKDFFHLTLRNRVQNLKYPANRQVSAVQKNLHAYLPFYWK